tara:strand:+ start:2251 stop:2724 length:474 start_codon:yes stop_codon:yes gene_type:complete
MRVGVTGHQSIPPKIVAFIEAGIKQALRDNAADLVGVSSLAAGADQLFSRIVLRMGGSIHAIIPSADYEDAFKDDEAREEYRELLVLAAVIEQLDHNSPSEEAFLDAGQHVVDRSDRLIAVWDGDDAQGKGGTGDVVRYARERGIEVIVVWPEGVKR